ncbi:MAG: hypothetical protein AB1650_06960 [Candidatus Omnitrophota bacterium]
MKNLLEGKSILLVLLAGAIFFIIIAVYINSKIIEDLNDESSEPAVVSDDAASPVVKIKPRKKIDLTDPGFQLKEIKANVIEQKTETESSYQKPLDSVILVN